MVTTLEAELCPPFPKRGVRSFHVATTVTVPIGPVAVKSPFAEIVPPVDGLNDQVGVRPQELVAVNWILWPWARLAVAGSDLSTGGEAGRLSLLPS